SAYAFRRARVSDFQSTGAGLRLNPRRRRHPAPGTSHGPRKALEAILSADDYHAGLAERYGWINRALPAAALGDFVTSLAHRIAGFPAAGHVAGTDRVDAIALAPAEDFRRDSDLFGEAVRDPEAQARIRAAMKHGFQTPDAEMD